MTLGTLGSFDQPQQLPVEGHKAHHNNHLFGYGVQFEPLGGVFVVIDVIGDGSIYVESRLSVVGPGSFLQETHGSLLQSGGIQVVWLAGRESIGDKDISFFVPDRTGVLLLEPDQCRAYDQWRYSLIVGLNASAWFHRLAHQGG